MYVRVYVLGTPFIGSFSSSYGIRVIVLYWGYCIVLYCIALHCIALHCIVLHCTVLYCITVIRVISVIRAIRVISVISAYVRERMSSI